MITRIFRVQINSEKRMEFEAKFADISVKAVESQEGFLSVEIGKPSKWNPDEYLRLVKAFQFADQHGEVCPANWQPGQKTMIPDPLKNNYKEVISEAK